jgi:hypothetical protein
LALILALVLALSWGLDPAMAIARPVLAVHWPARMAIV